MASKTKKRAKKRRSSQSSLSQLKTNLEKGNFKQALKDARVCWRQESSPEHRTFLEFAYIGRAQELRRKRDHDACRNVLQQFLELGPQEPAVLAALPEILLWAGMLDQLSSELGPQSDQDRDEWTAKVADQAVLQPDGGTHSQDVRDGVNRIHAALQSLYEGDSAAALRSLSDIASSSPFADWKLFARGLAAYYDDDSDRMQANWSRLHPDRAAFRIAQTLSVVAGTKILDRADFDQSTALESLERALHSESLSAQLRVLCRQVDDEQMSAAFLTLRGICAGLRQKDPALCQRLAQCMYARTVRKGQVSGVDHLAKSIKPLPMDPHWNRARALVRENSPETHPDAPQEYWETYVDDIAESTGWSSSQKAQAQALVLMHLSDSYRQSADSWRRCRCGDSHEEEVSEDVGKALVCLENSVRLAPLHAQAYEALADLHNEADQPAKAAAVYRQTLQHLPDHFGAMVALAEYHLENDEPILAQRYAKQASRSKPLNRSARILLWITHVIAARVYACREEFARSRSELQDADTLMPERRNDFGQLGRRAILERKAGCPDAAQSLVKQAKETLEAPAPLWLVMAIEAVCFELPREDIRSYEKSWTDALKRRCSGEVAGRMSQLASERLYPMTNGQMGQLVAYLKRCSRVKWRAEDLRAVCDLLQGAAEYSVVRKYARKGIKFFGKDAYFHCIWAILEIERGPANYQSDKMRTSLETAIDLATGCDDPGDQEVLNLARRTLTVLDQLESEPYHGDVGTEFIDDWESGEDGDSSNETPSLDSLPKVVLDKIKSIIVKMGLDPDTVLAEQAASGRLSENVTDRVID